MKYIKVILCALLLTITGYAQNNHNPHGSYTTFLAKKDHDMNYETIKEFDVEEEVLWLSKWELENLMSIENAIAPYGERFFAKGRDNAFFIDIFVTPENDNPSDVYFNYILPLKYALCGLSIQVDYMCLDVSDEALAKLRRDNWKMMYNKHVTARFFDRMYFVTNTADGHGGVAVRITRSKLPYGVTAWKSVVRSTQKVDPKRFGHGFRIKYEHKKEGLEDGK